MSTSRHTPIPTSPKAAANAATFNAPLSQLDSAIVVADNKADLLLASMGAGTGWATTLDGTTTPAVNEQQTVTITGTPTGGTFTLTFAGQTTAAIAYNAAAAAVVSALESLSNIGAGEVTATGGALPGTPVVVTFLGQYAGTNVSQMTAVSALTGGTVPAVTVTTTTAGTGGNVVPVASTVGAVAGMPVYLGLTSGTHEVGVIDTISAGVSVTLVANLAATYAAGTPISATPAEVADARGGSTTLKGRLELIRADVINVKEYGALGDGVTDDRAAVQAAIGAAIALPRSGVVAFPPGYYVIGTPGLVLPEAMQLGITLQGAGMNGTGGSATMLIRGGTYPLITAIGTSATVVSYGLQVKDMTLHGGSQTGPLIILDKSAGGMFENVRVWGCTDTAITSDQMWNWVFRHCNFEVSGNAGTVKPVIFLGVPTLNDEQTATVMFDSCIFEGNNYTDVQLTGNAIRQVIGVVFTNCKWERNVAGSCLVLSSTRGCQVIGGSMTQLNTNAMPMVSQSGDSFGNSLIGAYLLNNEYGGNPSTADYAVDLTDGEAAAITGCTFVGAKTAHIHLGAACGSVTIVGNMHSLLTSGATPPATILDDRPRSVGIVNPNAGILGAVANDKLLLASLGGLATVAGNEVNLGVRLHRTGAGTSYATMAVRLSLDVDNVPFLGGNLWLAADGGIGVGSTGAARLYSGTGTPEGAVAAAIGSLFLRLDGGVSTTLYVKTSGADNLGWTAK